MPADARGGARVQCSTPTGAPVYFRAPAGASPGQTVYVPWPYSFDKFVKVSTTERFVLNNFAILGFFFL